VAMRFLNRPFSWIVAFMRAGKLTIRYFGAESASYSGTQLYGMQFSWNRPVLQYGYASTITGPLSRTNFRASAQYSSHFVPWRPSSDRVDPMRYALCALAKPLSLIFVKTIELFKPDPITCQCLSLYAGFPFPCLVQSPCLQVSMRA
jgi:hypothetical protein